MLGPQQPFPPGPDVAAGAPAQLGVKVGVQHLFRRGVGAGEIHQASPGQGESLGRAAQVAVVFRQPLPEEAVEAVVVGADSGPPGQFPPGRQPLHHILIGQKCSGKQILPQSQGHVPPSHGLGEVAGHALPNLPQEPPSHMYQ